MRTLKCLSTEDDPNNSDYGITWNHEYCMTPKRDYCMTPKRSYGMIGN